MPVRHRSCGVRSMAIRVRKATPNLNSSGFYGNLEITFRCPASTMPISFPFFARRSPGSGASASAPACQVPLAKLPPAAPTGRLLPEAGPSQSLLQRPNPHLETAVPLTSPAPLRPLTGDLTAQAVHQCELPAPLPSGLAASVLGTQSAAPNERSNGRPSPQLPTPTPAEAPGPAWPPI